MRAAVSDRLPLSRVLAFAAVGIPVQALQLAVAVHLPRYFASTLGMSLAMVGACFALVRLIDVPLDAVLGAVMDRTRTRFGRYRLWLACGAPVWMAGFYMLMISPHGVGRGYLTTWLLVMYLGYSMVYLAHMAWAGALARRYEERSRVFGAIMGLGVAGAVAVLVIPVTMGLKGFSDGEGVRAMLWFLIAAAPIAIVIALFRTPETLSPDRGEPFRLTDYLALLKRGNVIRLMASDLLVTLGPGWMAALYLFYAKDARGFDTGSANILLMGYVASGFIGAPFTAWLAGRIGKHQALAVAILAYCACLLVLPLMPRGQYLPTLPSMFVAGAMYAGQLVMLRAITGDIADEIRLEIGREQMGLMYALTNCTTKLGSAASIFLTFWLLEHVGYQAQDGAINTPHAVHNLQLIFLVGPVVFLIAGAACFIGYRLNAKRHGEIRAQLDARDGV
jgi:GPH family glycoside/pentoside/hexuronide:cation symporter